MQIETAMWAGPPWRSMHFSRHLAARASNTTKNKQKCAWLEGVARKTSKELTSYPSTPDSQKFCRHSSSCTMPTYVAGIGVLVLGARSATVAALKANRSNARVSIMQSSHSWPCRLDTPYQWPCRLHAQDSHAVGCPSGVDRNSSRTDHEARCDKEVDVMAITQHILSV